NGAGLAQRRHRPGDEQRGDHAELDERGAGHVGHSEGGAGPVGPAWSEGINEDRLGHQYTPSMTAASPKRATGETSATESPACPGGGGIRVARSRSRLLGSSMFLLTWFITTWPRSP